MRGFKTLSFACRGGVIDPDRQWLELLSEAATIIRFPFRPSLLATAALAAAMPPA